MGMNRELVMKASIRGTGGEQIQYVAKARQESRCFLMLLQDTEEHIICTEYSQSTESMRSLEFPVRHDRVASDSCLARRF